MMAPLAHPAAFMVGAAALAALAALAGDPSDILSPLEQGTKNINCVFP